MLDRVRPFRGADELGRPGRDTVLIVWETHQLPLRLLGGGGDLQPEQAASGQYTATLEIPETPSLGRPCAFAADGHIIGAFVARDYPDEREPKGTPG